MTSDAETIANLRAAIAERDSEIRWLRDELRHADRLLLDRRRRVDDVSAAWQVASEFAPEGGGTVVIEFTDPSKPKADP